MTNLDKICHKLMDSNHELNAKCALLEKENEQLKSRVGYLERKIDRERISHQKQHEKWEEEIQKENEQLKADKQLLIDFIKKEFPKSHKHILERFE